MRLALAPGMPPLPFKDAKHEVIQRFERSYLLELVRSASTISAMSRASGLSRRHLRTLLEKHRLSG